MKKEITEKTKVYKIDATGKSMGRIASEAANYLSGKNLVTYARNIYPDVSVTISHASKITLRDTKRQQKQYEKYSGYPGGLTFDNLDRIIARKGHKEAIRLAVYGMLPSNRLRARMMKNIEITD